MPQWKFFPQCQWGKEFLSNFLWGKIYCFQLLFADQIDENLKKALQEDLTQMAPGLKIQVHFLPISSFTRDYKSTSIGIVVWWSLSLPFVQEVWVRFPLWYYSSLGKWTYLRPGQPIAGYYCVWWRLSRSTPATSNMFSRIAWVSALCICIMVWAVCTEPAVSGQCHAFLLRILQLVEEWIINI